jgi:hypothetical protein
MDAKTRRMLVYPNQRCWNLSYLFDIFPGSIKICNRYNRFVTNYAVMQ